MLDGFARVDYKQRTRFSLQKTLTHNNLVEVNANALRETYDIDEAQYKDLIGNLNWKKFSDRIQEQMQKNALLTIEQKQLMQVNGIVASLRSH